MRRLLSLFAFLALSLTAAAQDQWERLPGPTGTEVTSIIKFDNKIYAGTYSGIFFSDDQGISWQPDLNGMDGGMFIWSMATNGDKLIAATSVGIYYKTPGSGWQVSQMLSIMMKVVSNGEVFLAKAYSNFNTYRSTDGITWQYTGHAAGAIGTSGDYFFIDTTADILRSTNALTWEGIDANLPGFGYSAIWGDGSVLMVSRFEGGVYRSTNNGDSFTQVTFPTGGTFPYRAHNFAFHGNTVYANTFAEVDEIYFSTDYGITWQKRNPGLYPSVFGWGGMIVEDDYQLVASYEGIHHSTNGGQTWTFGTSNGLANSTLNGLLVNQGSIHALTGYDVGGSFGFYSSTDMGESWNAPAMQHFGRHGNIAFGTVINNIILVKNGFTLSRSTDNGLTWTNILTAPDNINALFTLGNRVLMATSQKIHYSDNAGLTWTEAPSSNFMVNCLTSKDGVVYAGTSTGIQKSTNNGTTWTNLSPVIAGPYDVITMASNSNYLYAAIQSGGAYIQLYRSGDNGVTWTNIQGTLPQGYWSTIAINGNTILTGTNPVGVDFNDSYLYKSTDNGTTWELFETGMFVESDITYLGYFDNKWWAGTESAGLWVVGDGTLSTGDVTSAEKISVYPNPATDIIHINIPNAGGCGLLLSDMNGRVVKSMNSDHGKSAIDLSGLAPAIYILKVNVGEESEIFKVVKK